MAEQTDELETPYKKGSQKKTPPKADHQHEYVRPYAMNYMRYFDGSISKVKYKFTLPVECIECGYSPRRVGKRRVVVDVEITPKEFQARQKRGV